MATFEITAPPVDDGLIDVPCAICGTREIGKGFDGGKFARKTGRRFGVDGLLCSRCWWALYGRKVRGHRILKGPRCKVVYVVCIDCGAVGCYSGPKAAGRKRCDACAKADAIRRGLEALRVWKEAHPEEAKEVQRAAVRRWQARNPEKVRALAAAAYLRRRPHGAGAPPQEATG